MENLLSIDNFGSLLLWLITSVYLGYLSPQEMPDRVRFNVSFQLSDAILAVGANGRSPLLTAD